MAPSGTPGPANGKSEREKKKKKKKKETEKKNSSSVAGLSEPQGGRPAGRKQVAGRWSLQFADGAKLLSGCLAADKRRVRLNY